MLTVEFSQFRVVGISSTICSSSLYQRIIKLSNFESFLVAETEGRVIGFINGAVTAQRTISDDMFEDAGLHNPEGAYQSIFGLDVVEEFRCQGIASRLMEEMIERARRQGRRGLILTCKDRLIGYYERFGYVNLGVSQSVHGGAVWYDMLLEFGT